MTAQPRPSLAGEDNQQKYATEGDRWNAVWRRDPEADGKFYFGVRSTGVYCRPSCAARRARREQVEFFTSCAAAELAGFRPCKRCQPHGPALEQLHAAAVTKACRLIETADMPPGLAALAKAADMSPFHFHRVFKKLVGLTPKDYAEAHRAKRVREELTRRGSVTEAFYEAGYNSTSRFYSKSAEVLGMRPGQFRKGGTGVAIRFGVGNSSLGRVLVAASERGVCAIALGEDVNELVRDLRERFPKAKLIDGDKGFERLVSHVVGLVESPRRRCELPLDVRGTAFQQRVWQALRKIRAGETVSYSELANRIGSPRAVRAVARACAANPVAVAIPCHRVRRTDGNLAGYRWGVERKRALLDREAVPEARAR